MSLAGLEQSSGNGGDTGNGTSNVSGSTSLERRDRSSSRLGRGGGVGGLTSKSGLGGGLVALLARDGVSDGVESSGVGGWHNTWLSDGQGGLLGNSDNSWLANVVADSEGQSGGGWAVGGVAGHGHVGGDGGDVSVRSQSGGGQSRQGSESRELHDSE